MYTCITSKSSRARCPHFYYASLLEIVKFAWPAAKQKTWEIETYLQLLLQIVCDVAPAWSYSPRHSSRQLSWIHEHNKLRAHDNVTASMKFENMFSPCILQCNLGPMPAHCPDIYASCPPKKKSRLSRMPDINYAKLLLGLTLSFAVVLWALLSLKIMKCITVHLCMKT